MRDGPLTLTFKNWKGEPRIEPLNQHQADQNVIFDLCNINSRIQTHCGHLSKIIQRQIYSSFLEEAQAQFEQHGRLMFVMAGEFEGFHVEQPG